jgi:hypothetical protein
MRIGPYRTRKGLTFELSWERVAVPSDAQYWQYVIDARLPSGLGRGFTMLIRNPPYTTQDAADAFLVTDPLTEVKGQLDLADAESIPRIWPPLRDDWFLF